MAQPSQQEIISYVRQVAAQYGIDPNVMLRIIKQESGFNPAARGDGGHSVGLAQLFDAGLQQDFRQQMGVDPADPSNWKQQIEFMARHASQTKGKIGGWNPWHGARDVGIAQYEGLGGTATPTTPNMPGAPGQRDRDVTTPQGVAQPYMAQGGSQPNMMDFFKQWQEANQPRPTLAGAVLRGFGVDTGGKKDLASLAFSGFGDGKSKLQQEVDKLNPFAPMSDQAQLDAKLKPKQQTVAGALLGRKPAVPAPAPTQQGPTLFSALAGIKKADTAAGNATPNATLFKYLFG